MAFTADFGEANPMVADIAKGATVSIAVALLSGQRMPSFSDLAVPAGALVLYWTLVHTRLAYLEK